MRSNTLKLMMLFLFTTTLFSGCTKDTTTPESTDVRTAFLGKWSVSETWTKLSYEVTITTDPNSNNGVFISNFADAGASGIPAAAVVSGSSITLDANQVIGEGLKINGSGTLLGSKITWNYTLDNGATLIQAIATYTKQ